GELFEDIFINESDEIVPSNDIYKIKLAKNLRAIREAKGLTREEMSFALKFDSSYVSKLEKGRINITIDKIILIADFLGVRLPDLFK
ncbi:MAG: helix-turn-helix transcriptional regulator, partial [bacterium]|nr:helix-turn-helix transcriptional regulator [bacterium]